MVNNYLLNSGQGLLRNTFALYLKMELSFFCTQISFPCNILSLVICNFQPYFKSTKYLNIQTYDFKEINVLDGQL